jgi:hypothetical protein
MLISHGGAVSEYDKQTHLQNWRIHAPQNVPDGWSSTLWFDERIPHLGECGNLFIGGLGEGSIGDWIWDIENAMHYVGRVIPLMIKTGPGSLLLLLQVGRVLFLCDPLEGEVGLYAVINPEIDWNTIMGNLSNCKSIYDDEIEAVGWRSLEKSVVHARAQIRAYYAWERRNGGKDRWRELKARGGEVNLDWWDAVVKAYID